MHKVDSGGATLANEFTNGDAGAGVPRTTLAAKWLNSVQREMLAPIEQLGIAPTDADDKQLLSAMVLHVLNLAALRALPVPSVGGGRKVHVYVEGWTTSDDGGDGAFRWEAASAAADDNENVVKPAANPVTGRWVRVQTTARYRRSGQETILSTPIVDWTRKPQDLERYTKNAVPGATDMSAGWQRAVDSATAASPTVRFSQQCALSKPIIIGADTVQSLTFEGISRTISLMAPLSIDIKQPTELVNALIINKADNGHMHLKGLRAFSDIAYAGHFFYAVENGCADGSGEAAFSMHVEDSWFSFANTNAGYFRGAFSNLYCAGNVWEYAKDACWILEGAGNGDLVYVGNRQYNCYDSFIRADDGYDKALITVIAHHAYGHHRGRLFKAHRVKKIQLIGVTLEPASIADGNLGDLGMLQLSNCPDVIASGLSMMARTDVPPGACFMELSGITTAKISGSAGTAAIGFKIPSTGFDGTPTSIEAELTSCDFSGTEGFPTSVAGGMIESGVAGNLRTHGAKWNNSVGHCFGHAGPNDLAWNSYGDEFINCGIEGNGGARCLDLYSSKAIVLHSPRIGRESVDAVGSHYIRANGTGTVTLINPIIVGNPPTAFSDGTQPITIIGITGNVPLAYSPSIDVNAIAGNVFTVNVTDGTAFSINSPGNSYRGMRITVRVRNVSGGAAGVLTWGATFKMAAWVQPANGFSRSIDFDYNGTAWIEQTRNMADVPN